MTDNQMVPLADVLASEDFALLVMRWRWSDYDEYDRPPKYMREKTDQLVDVLRARFAQPAADTPPTEPETRECAQCEGTGIGARCETPWCSDRSHDGMCHVCGGSGFILVADQPQTASGTRPTEQNYWVGYEPDQPLITTGLIPPVAEQPTAVPDDLESDLPGGKRFVAREASFEAGFHAGVQAAKTGIAADISRIAYNTDGWYVRQNACRVAEYWQPDPAPKDGK